MMTEPLIVFVLTINLSTTQIEIEYPMPKLCEYAMKHIRQNAQVVSVSCEARLQTIKNGVSE
jgi:hypothetical protein